MASARLRDGAKRHWDRAPAPFECAKIGGILLNRMPRAKVHYAAVVILEGAHHRMGLEALPIAIDARKAFVFANLTLDSFVVADLFVVIPANLVQ